MPAAAANRPVRRWRPNGRLRLLLGAFITGCVVLQALAEWRDKHLFLINTTHSLPNWAFLIDRGRMPAKGEFIFFDPPASPLMQRHFGPKPRMFGKKVYGVGGDVVGHDGFEVLINGVPTVRMKPFTKAGEPLTPGATGVVPKGCYFAATPHMDGFDSRYAEIGFVCGKQIIGTGEPIL